MAFTVFLGNLPVWVTADDISAWLAAENLVADSIKVIRNPETQESKGFAFIESPNKEEMESIIRRFDRAPLEDRLLRANPAQPPKGKGAPMGPPMAGGERPQGGPPGDRGMRAGDRKRGGLKPTGGGRRPQRNDGPPSAFAEELAKAL
jgi:RNA recognition motif-containing protein